MEPEPYDQRVGAGPAALDSAFRMIGAELPRRVRAWDIGGGPMVYRGLKAGTKDVDLVVDQGQDRDAIVAILLAHGYEEFGGLPEYRGFEAVLLRKPRSLGVDVFVVRIMQKFYLSESMKQRADGPHRFGNLDVHHCSNEDIFLLKAITHRPDDDDDVLALAGTPLDGKVLYDEARVQQRRTGENWPWKIFHALSEIERRKGVPVAVKSDVVD